MRSGQAVTTPIDARYSILPYSPFLVYAEYIRSTVWESGAYKAYHYSDEDGTPFFIIAESSRRRRVHIIIHISGKYVFGRSVDVARSNFFLLFFIWFSLPSSQPLNDELLINSNIVKNKIQAISITRKHWSQCTPETVIILACCKRATS